MKNRQLGSRNAKNVRGAKAVRIPARAPASMAWAYQIGSIDNALITFGRLLSPKMTANIKLQRFALSESRQFNPKIYMSRYLSSTYACHGDRTFCGESGREIPSFWEH